MKYTEAREIISGYLESALELEALLDAAFPTEDDGHENKFNEALSTAVDALELAMHMNGGKEQ